MGEPDRPARKASKRRTVHLRVDQATLDLIDRAARMQGRSRTDFMVEASRCAAEGAILDQAFEVSQETYDHLLAALDRPPESDVNLQKLLRTKARWDR
jgi:uncharacterized protein (DUF1778 family)